MRVFKATIPHKYKTGKSQRKITTNAIMSMHWGNRQTIHDTYQHICRQCIAHWDRGRLPDTRYRVTLGFYAGKSTKIVDLDNLFFCMKWFTDVFKEHIGIDDNYNVIIESRIIYAGKQKDEELVAQVEETMDIVGKR